MKSETEFKWLVNLLNSNLNIMGFVNNQGCKRDFEKKAGASTNDKFFSVWFYDLVEDGVINKVTTKSYGRGKPVRIYKINKRLMEKKLTQNEFYPSVIRYMDNRKYLLRISS